MPKNVLSTLKSFLKTGNNNEEFKDETESENYDEDDNELQSRDQEFGNTVDDQDRELLEVTEHDESQFFEQFQQ